MFVCASMSTCFPTCMCVCMLIHVCVRDFMLSEPSAVSQFVFLVSVRFFRLCLFLGTSPNETLQPKFAEHG